MSLASKLAFRFDRHIQFKAHQLFDARAVQVIEESPQHFWARIQNGGPYEVHLTYKQGSLVVSCDCRNAEDAGLCRHIWAGILQADRRGASNWSIG